MPFLASHLIHPIVLCIDSTDCCALSSFAFSLFIFTFQYRRCDHCKKLAPEWERMAREWTDKDRRGFVGEVDCTAQQKFCDAMHAQGSPTTKYGDPAGHGTFLEEYNDDKDYEALSSFANNTLGKAICSPLNTDPCDEETRTRIETFMAMTYTELKDGVKAKEDEIKAAAKNFKSAFRKMQAEYDTKSSDHQLEVARIKANIKLIQSMLDQKRKDGGK